MKMKNCVVFCVVLITMSMCASCSQEDIIADIGQQNLNDPDVTTRAVSDIFNVKEIVFPDNYYVWIADPHNVDREGNFYWLANIDGNYDVNFIVKYDHKLDTFQPFCSFDGHIESNFFFDERNNLCYLTYDYPTETYSLKRVRADGNAVIEQPLELPMWTHIDDVSVATNGNIFMLSGETIYRLSTNGLMTRIEPDFSAYPTGLWVTNIFKANGSIAYLYRYWTGLAFKVDMNTGVVEEINLRYSPRNSGNITASPTKANLYALDNKRIIQIRPNAASNLVIGSIPSKYVNSDGQFVETANCGELFMNPEGDIFYSVLYDYGFYKFSLN